MGGVGQMITNRKSKITDVIHELEVVLKNTREKDNIDVCKYPQMVQ